MTKSAPRWYPIVNDLTGGWCVSSFDAPMADHDFRLGGDAAKCGYIVADCMDEPDARTIADLLNGVGYVPVAFEKSRARWAPLSVAAEAEM